MSLKMTVGGKKTESRGAWPPDRVRNRDPDANSSSPLSIVQSVMIRHPFLFSQEASTSISILDREETLARAAA